MWQIEISEVTEVQLHDKKGYLTLSITFRRDGRIMLRSSSGIDKWFSLIKVGSAHLCAGTRLETSASKSSIRRFVITEKAPTRAFSLLKAATTAFTFKTLC